MAARFQSPGGLFRSPSHADTNDMWEDSGSTIMFWINRASAGGGSNGMVLSFAEGSDRGWKLSTTSDNRLKLQCDYSTADGEWTTNASTIPNDTWVHVALFYVENVAVPPVVYLDGVLATVNEDSTPVGVQDHPNKDLLIGSNEDYVNYLDGQIADLRFYVGDVTDSAQDVYAQAGNIGLLGYTRRYPFGPHIPGQAATTPFRDLVLSEASDVLTLNVTVPEHAEGDLLVIIGMDSGDGSASEFDPITGWNADIYLPLTGGLSAPAMAIYSRTATDSEPATYPWTSNIVSPMSAHMASFRGASSVLDVSATDDLTGGNVDSPTVTPTEDVMLILFAGIDQGNLTVEQPTGQRIMYDFRTLIGAGNEGRMGWGVDSWDATATGARTWGTNGSDQFGAGVVAYPWGHGRGGLPGIDLSSNQVRLESEGHVTTDADELTIRG